MHAAWLGSAISLLSFENFMFIKWLRPTHASQKIAIWAQNSPNLPSVVRSLSIAHSSYLSHIEDLLSDLWYGEPNRICLPDSPSLALFQWVVACPLFIWYVARKPPPSGALEYLVRGRYNSPIERDMNFGARETPRCDFPLIEFNWSGYYAFCTEIIEIESGFWENWFKRFNLLMCNVVWLCPVWFSCEYWIKVPSPAARPTFLLTKVPWNSRTTCVILIVCSCPGWN